MTLKQECPVCRKSANEGHIRPMVALEEVVESWKAARCVSLLAVCSDPYDRTDDLARRSLVLMLATVNGDSGISTPEERSNTIAGPSTPSKRRKIASRDGEG